MIEKLSALFASITNIVTAEDAKKALYKISLILYSITLINLIIALLTNNPNPILDAWFILIFGITIRHNQSRAGGILLIFYALNSIAGSIYCQYNLLADARSILLNTMVIVLAIPAIHATFRYHALRKSHIIWKNAFIKTLHALLYLILFSIITQFSIIFRYIDFLYELGGYQLLALISLILPTIGVFLTFNGWLPFTRHEPVCRFENEETTKPAI